MTTTLRQNFTIKEKESGALSAFRVLKRFMFSLPAFKYVILPTFIFTCLAALTPQLFLWLTGQYIECGEGTSSCLRDFYGIPVKLSLTLIAGAFLLRACYALLGIDERIGVSI